MIDTPIILIYKRTKAKGKFNAKIAQQMEKLTRYHEKNRLKVDRVNLAMSGEKNNERTLFPTVFSVATDSF